MNKKYNKNSNITIVTVKYYKYIYLFKITVFCLIYIQNILCIYEWMMHFLYSALMCIFVHPKRFTIMCVCVCVCVGGLFIYHKMSFISLVAKLNFPQLLLESSVSKDPSEIIICWYQDTVLLSVLHIINVDNSCAALYIYIYIYIYVCV